LQNTGVCAWLCHYQFNPWGEEVEQGSKIPMPWDKETDMYPVRLYLDSTLPTKAFTVFDDSL
jgi:hypothetical protein